MRRRRAVAAGLLSIGRIAQAVLVHAPTPPTSGPSAATGWGVVDLATLFDAHGARKMIVRDVRHVDGLTTGDQSDLEVTVEENTEPLKVTLAWTDPPGGVGAARASVNHLTLRLTAPDGTEVANRRRSGDDNVDSVTVHGPQPGQWVVPRAATEGT